MLLAFHKPYGVISQFTPDGSKHATLAGFGFPPRLYPIGRLDADSEGLLLLSDEPALNRRLLHPLQRHPREYWVQVERIPALSSLQQLAEGLQVQNHLTRPCRVRLLEPAPEVPPRTPPIRHRKTVPTAWLAMELTEGKNRQVRRMTAAVGHPTLRLVRVRIGRYALGALAPGTWVTLDPAGREAVLGGEPPPQNVGPTR
jgi:23S rRNA pseudouridine2457 synthase